jgi:SAM-dependent methyltransferase
MSGIADTNFFRLDESKVIRTVSPDDDMFDRSLDEYIETGREALRLISLAALAVPKTGFQRILDLPCGYGRVLRVLRAAFPRSEITACDLDKRAVDFCAETFGAVTAYSDRDPSRIMLSGQFDLIWCGSLLTHLDVDHWTGFLDLFERVLAPYGVLALTTHGRI